MTRKEESGNFDVVYDTYIVILWNKSVFFVLLFWKCNGKLLEIQKCKHFIR